ncbi:hypothetical protein L7F22_016620 [Adiantum nelumboides]|nr:hypothetical protein [Adiantum nelumboides]
MMHNYFGSSHGKGEHDGAGTVIKRALTHEQLKVDGHPLYIAALVVNYLNLMNNTKDCCPSANKVDRVFWEIKVGDVLRDIEWDCKKIGGSRSMHCVNGFSSRDMIALRCRNLSRFYHACMHGQWRRCANKAHIEAWQYLRIIPAEADIDDVSSDEEIKALMYVGHHNDLSDALWVGDNFAINAEEEYSDFYILRCCTEKRLSTMNQKDAWHN